MSERLTPELLEKFVGLSAEPIKVKVRAKQLSALAEAIGLKDEKYIGATPAMNPAYIGTTVIKGLFALADAAVKDDDGNDVKMVTNPGKILHGAMGYKFFDEPVNDGDILIAEGSITKAEIKNGKLFFDVFMTTRKEDGTPVQETKIGVICREGGF
jgi:hypothetical protein